MRDFKEQFWSAVENMPFKDLLAVSEYILEGWDSRFEDVSEEEKPVRPQDRYYAFANALSDYAESWKEDFPTPPKEEA